MVRLSDACVTLGATAAILALGACGGGGGSGGGSYAKRAQLLAVTFPDPSDVNPEASDSPPADAPLVQQVVLTFDGSPDPNRISISTVQIRNANNLPVPGTFTVDGVVVTFTPTIPKRAATVSGSGAVDTGGAGLEPGATYTIRLGPQSFAFVASVAASLRSRFPDPIDPLGVLIGFKTTTNLANFFAGLPLDTPQLLSSDPVDGATGISPNLFSDPDALFPPRRTFRLTFDRPLNPAASNVSDATFRLIDLDDTPSSSPSGLSLGVDVAILSNDVDESVVEITPSGILPFGHLLSLEYPTALRGLSDTTPPSGTSSIAATFTIAAAPATTIHDELVEDFHTTAGQESDPSQIATGVLPADWDVQDSNVLQAGFAFQGDGALGKFQPPKPPAGTTVVVTLDTSRQVFPLPDGSTPDAPPGFVVIGGVFAFTDIDIPLGIVVKPLGSNPLVLSATGSVRVAGQIIVAGEDGTPESSYDSAVTSIPGGQSVAAGGRGGESHPIIFFPPDQISYLTLVSPLFGGTGFGIDPADGVMKRIGGTGGQCGCLDQTALGKYTTDQEIDCTEFRSSHLNEKVPGGGGGSMLGKGTTPTNTNTKLPLYGIGNVKPDGTGHFTVDDDKTLLCGVGGQHPFFDDGNANNDFYGKKGQVTRLIGGQGGGGGASLTESYYCGIWCDHDDDPANDSVCAGTDFGDPPKRGDSVGDARGGGGGAGGGVLLIQALGPITLESTAFVDASGGFGKGGEGLGCSYFGGGGGGGAGGSVFLQSGTSIVVSSGAVIDVQNGTGYDTETGNSFFAQNCGTGNPEGDPGDAGSGGAGLIQLQVPSGQTAAVVNASSSLKPTLSWADPTNTLNPVEFTPTSVALSRWFDLGRVTTRPPLATNPVFSFDGLDAQGYVVTDASGNIPDAAAADLVAGYAGQRDPLTNYKLYKLGEEPRGDFVPQNATIRIEFQGADPIVEGSKEVDPATLTAWTGSPTIASGMKFLRWRVTFDITADGSAISPTTRIPTVQRIEVPVDF